MPNRIPAEGKYYLLETLAKNELGRESLSQIIQMVEEQILC